MTNLIEKFKSELKDKLGVAHTAGNASRSPLEKKLVLRQCEDFMIQLFEDTLLEILATGAPPLPSADAVQRIEASLESLHGKVESLMTSQDQITTLLGQMNTATNQVADRLSLQLAEIQRLTAALAAAGTISPAEQAALDATGAAIQTEINRLTALAADPANPVPAVPPVDPNPPVPSNG